MKASAKSMRLPLLLIAHGFTQVGISLPDQTWRAWMNGASSQALAVCAGTLFTVRLVVDSGLFLWILGPERREHAWVALARLNPRSHLKMASTASRRSGSPG